MPRVAPTGWAALAADLVERKVDVLVAYTNAAAFAARAATGSIPIVVWAAHDAVGTGLVASLSRPGGNVTGVESLAPELDSKRVQFVRELLPAAKRLAAFYNPADPGAAAHLRAIREAAAVLGFEVLPIEIADRDGVDRALATFASLRPDALLTITDPVTNHAFDRFAEAARLARTPTMCEFREFTQRGCVMAYGATLAEFNQRVLRFIELIRKGARPADLPLEQVTRFELAMNMKAARAIGVVPPASILLRADHVIE